MGYMTINNRRVAFTDEKNVLSVIRKSGIDLPTFCYHSELSTYGAVVCAWWKMTEGRFLHPAPKYQEMEW